MKIHYLGLKNNKFRYQVELNGHTFDYFTGIGWIAWGKQSDQLKYKRLDFTETQEVLSQQPRNFWARKEYNPICYRRLPSEIAILECLSIDCDAGRMTFHEFCDSFGHDQDSIKAFKTYMACQETANKLSGFKFPDFNEVQS